MNAYLEKTGTTLATFPLSYINQADSACTQDNQVEATGSAVLSIMPLSSVTGDSPGAIANLQESTEIAGNTAISPSELFSSLLSQLTVAPTPVPTESDGIQPIVAPAVIDDLLPLSGNLLPPSIHAIATNREIQTQDGSLATAISDVAAEVLDPSDLQTELLVTGVAVTPVTTPDIAIPAAITAAPTVTTLLSNSIQAKPQTTRPISEVAIIDGEPVGDDRPAPVVTATREIPVELIARSDLVVTNQQGLPSIAADGSNGYATATQIASQPTSATTTTSQPSFTINHPITDAQWGDRLSQRVVWMTENGMGRAEIRLNPPELGPLNVSVTVANDEAKVAFNVQHGTTRELVEAALPRLREMFAAQGLELTDASVSQNAPQDRHQADDTGQFAHRTGYDNTGLDAESENIEGHSTTTTIRQGLIDTYV